MPTYLVEIYAPRSSDISELVAHARAADGARHLRSIFVPDDEVCFHLFSASVPPRSMEGVGRLVQVVEGPSPPGPEGTTGRTDM